MFIPSGLPTPGRLKGKFDLKLNPLCRRDTYIFYDPTAVYMNWALLGPGLRNSTAAERYAMDRASGPRLFEEFSRIADATRSLVGQLFGYEADRVFLTGNASTALFTLLDVFATQFPSGTVIATDRAYATLTLGIESKIKDCVWCEPRTEAFVQALKRVKGPAMLAIEGQEYQSGSRYDIPRIIQVAADLRRAGKEIYVTLDLSQWPSSYWKYEDFVSILVSAPKWSGGTNGSSYGIVAPLLQITPGYKGWGSLEGSWTYPIHRELKSTAACLDAMGGGKPWLPIYFLQEGLTHVRKLGMSNIEHHVVALAYEARTELVAAGLNVLPVEFPSGNTCIGFESPTKAREFLLALVERGVVLSDGVSRVRISPMPQNNSEEMEKVIRTIIDLHRKLHA